jgi:hypothetical protein
VSKKKHPGLQEAIALLASKFEFGALLAETTPAFFLQMVAEEIDRLRASQPSKIDEAFAAACS